MKSILKKLVVSFATVICAVCAFAGAVVSFDDDKVVAKAETTIDTNYFFMYGEDLRLVNDANGAGLRFYTYIKADLFPSNVAETGTLIVPEHLYDGDLTLDDLNKVSSQRPVVGKSTDAWTDGGAYTDPETNETYDVKKSIVYVYNMAPKTYGWRMVSRSYIKFNDGSVAYSTASSKSISEVAEYAKESVAGKTDDASQKLLFQVEPFIVETVDVTVVDLYGITTTSAVAYGSKFDVPDSCKIHTGSAFEVNFYDQNGKKWNVENGEFTRDVTLTAKMEQKVNTEIVNDAFISLNGNTSKWGQTVPNADLAGVTAPAGFAKVSRFDAKEADVVGGDTLWKSGALGPSNYNIPIAKYKTVDFALKVVNGYLCNMKGWASFSSNNWIYFHLEQNDDATWTIEISSEGKTSWKFENQSAAAIDANRPEGSLATILYDNGSSAADGVGMTLYASGSTTVYSTEIIGVELQDPADYPAYNAEVVMNELIGDLSYSNGSVMLVANNDLNGVTAPIGFNNVTRFDAGATWTGTLAANSSFDRETKLGNYSEIWFAYKAVNCTFQYNWDQNVLVKDGWLYFHLTQTGKDETYGTSVWTIEVSYDGVVLKTLENQTSFWKQGHSYNETLVAILYAGFYGTAGSSEGNIVSDGHGFRFLYGDASTKPTIYATEMLGIGETVGVMTKPDYSAGTIINSIFTTGNHLTESADEYTGEIPVGFATVSTFETIANNEAELNKTNWASTVVTDYRQIWFAVNGTAYGTNAMPGWSQQTHSNNWLYFYLEQNDDATWNIKLVKNGAVFYTSLNQPATETGGGTVGSIYSILRGNFANDGTESIRLDVKDKTGGQKFYCTEVKAIRMDGEEITPPDEPSQGVGGAVVVTPSYKVKATSTSFGVWLGTNAVKNSDVGDVTISGFRELERYDSSTGWSDVLASATAFNYRDVLTSYDEIWFAYKMENCYIQTFPAWSRLVGDQVVFFHLTKTGVASDGATLWTIEISDETGKVVGTYLNQRGVSADIGTADTLAAIFYNGFNATKCTDNADFRFRKTDTSKTATFYASEVIGKQIATEDAKAMPNTTKLVESPVATHFTSAQASYAQITKNTDLAGVTAPAGFTTVTRLDAMAKWSTAQPDLSSGTNAWSNIANLAEYEEVWVSLKGVNASLGINGVKTIEADDWVQYRLTQTSKGVWTVEMSIYGKQVAIAEVQKDAPANLYDLGVRVRALANEGVSLYVSEVRVAQKTWGARVIWSAMDYAKPSTAVEVPYGFTQVYERTDFNDYFAKMDLSNTEYTQLRFGMIHSGNLYVDEARTRTITTKFTGTEAMYLVTLDRTADGWTVTMNCNTWASAGGSISPYVFTSTGNSLYEIFKEFNVWSGVTVYTTEVRGLHEHVHAKYTTDANAHTHASVCFCGGVIATESCDAVSTCTTGATCSVCGYTYALDAGNHVDETTNVVKTGGGTHDVVYVCCGALKETIVCDTEYVKGDWICKDCGDVVDTAREESKVMDSVFKAGVYLTESGDAYTGTMPEGFSTVTTFKGITAKGIAELGVQNWNATVISGYSKVRFAVTGSSLVNIQKKDYSKIATLNNDWYYFTFTQNDDATWTIEITSSNASFKGYVSQNQVIEAANGITTGSIYSLIYGKWTNASDGEAIRLMHNTSYKDTDGTTNLWDWTQVTLYSTEVLAWKQHEHVADSYVYNEDGTHNELCFCGTVVNVNVACTGNQQEGNCGKAVCELCNHTYGEFIHYGEYTWVENDYLCSVCGDAKASVTTETGTQYFALYTDKQETIALDGTVGRAFSTVDLASAFSDSSFTVSAATFDGTTLTSAGKPSEDSFEASANKQGLSHSVYGAGHTLVFTTEFYGKTFEITVPVIVVTNKITTDATMQAMKTILRGTDGVSGMKGEGYYLLGGNVKLTKNTIYSFGTSTTPFKGTFDGNGYTISDYDNIQWFNAAGYVFQDSTLAYPAYLEGSFFGVVDGLVKNVAFDTVRVGIYANLVHSGKGTIENVYVRPMSIQNHASTYTSLFFTEGHNVTGAGTLKNVVVDLATQATAIKNGWVASTNFSNPSRLFSAAVGSYFKAQNVALFGFDESYATEEIGNVYRGLNYKKTAYASDGRAEGIYVTYADLQGNATGKDNGGYFAYSQLDESIWKIVNGVPVLKNYNATAGEDFSSYVPSGGQPNTTFINEGATEYYLAWDWDTVTQAKFDAMDLISNYAYLSTGAQLKAGQMDVNSEGFKQIIVGTYAEYGAYIDDAKKVEDDACDNYGIYVENRTIYVLGETDESIMYAAKALASNLFGYGEVAIGDYAYIDNSDKLISLPDDYESAITFSLRNASTVLANKDHLTEEARIDQNKMGFSTASHYTTYGSKHNTLDYFFDGITTSSGGTIKSGYSGTASNVASSGQDRTKMTAQLCYTRDFRTKVNWVANIIKSQYEADNSIKVINFMVEDNMHHCKCTNCQKFSSPSVAHLIFLNEVAKTLDSLNVPVAIEFFAYSTHQPSPELSDADITALNDLVGAGNYATITRTLSYVNTDGVTKSRTVTLLKAHNDLRLEWTSHKVNHSFHLTDAENEEWYFYLLGWVEAMGGGDKIDLFLYNVFYRDYFLPMNTWEYQVTWYQEFNKLGIHSKISNLGVTPWGDAGTRNLPGTQTAFMAFKAYIDSRTMTDVNVTFEQLKDEFFSTNGYYGKGGPTMRVFFEELVASMEARKSGGTKALYKGNYSDLHWLNLEDGGYNTSNADLWRQANFNGYYNMGFFGYDYANATSSKVSGYTNLYTHDNLSQQATLERWYNYCQAAIEDVGADSVYGKRINIEALFPEYAFLHFNSTYTNLSTETKIKNGTATITSTKATSSVFTRSYQEFYNLVKASNVRTLSEFYGFDGKKSDGTYETRIVYDGTITNRFVYRSPFKNWGVTF